MSTKTARVADDDEQADVKRVKVEDVGLKQVVNQQATEEVTKNDDSELKTKIAKQVEYYFSDVNLCKDRFMQEQLKKNDNCVKLSMLLTFARLAKLTKAEDVLIDALKDVESDLIEVDVANKVIRRKKPIPDKEEYEKELSLRTVHISGFPDSLSFDDLHKYCSKYGEIESLSMRQHFKTKQFKGCIHVVFKDAADAKAVLEGDQLMFKDRELRRESMAEYHKRKEEMRQKREEKRRSKKKGGDLLESKEDKGQEK
jgi:lupus La protein